MNIEIYVVSHKKVKVPDEKIYIPVQVGKSKENFSGFFRDNTGDNISSKNETFCELTAQYWGVKNRLADVKGLVHYRRYFVKKKSVFNKDKFKYILKKNDIEKLIDKYDIILPHKRNYFIETTWSQYEHAHHIKDLITTRKVIEEKYPEYVECFDKVMKYRASHRFNMMIAKSDLFEKYTDWLLDVLYEVEKRTDISNYSKYDRRIYGFISERLLDVWIEKNNIKYTELPVVFIGNQHWGKKIYSFLKRKFVPSK